METEQPTPKYTVYTCKDNKPTFNSADLIEYKSYDDENEAADECDRLTLRDKIPALMVDNTKGRVAYIGGFR